MNILNKIKMDLQKEPNPSGYKKLLTKVFGISNQNEEHKDDAISNKDEEVGDAEYMRHSIHSELKTIKTLILDLSSIAKDNPEIECHNLRFNIEVFDEALTSGWLVCEVMRKYTEFIANIEQQTGAKIKKKLIVAIKVYDTPTEENCSKLSAYNESLNYWVTCYERTLEPLNNGQIILPHFSKYLPNRKKQICLNDFIIEKQIGKGGFSKVYLVRKKSSGLMYAMKVLDKSLLNEPRKLKQIENERKIMNLTDHPFIVKLYWAFQTNSTLNFVMDL